MVIINEVIQSLFVGFGIFILATSFLHFKKQERNELIASLTDSAIIMIRLATIAYLAIWLADLYKRYQSEEYYLMMSRLTGPYWFGYWIYPLCYGVFPQLLWIKPVKRIKAIRVITAFLFLFVLYIEKIVILVTLLHRDYVPSSWTMLPPYYVLYDWFVNLIIFGFVLSLTHFVRLKLTDAQHS
jgi:hypothetical protein